MSVRLPRGRLLAKLLVAMLVPATFALALFGAAAHEVARRVLEQELGRRLATAATSVAMLVLPEQLSAIAAGDEQRNAADCPLIAGQDDRIHGLRNFLAVDRRRRENESGDHHESLTDQREVKIQQRRVEIDQHDAGKADQTAEYLVDTQAIVVVDEVRQQHAEKGAGGVHDRAEPPVQAADHQAVGQGDQTVGRGEEVQPGAGANAEDLTVEHVREPRQRVPVAAVTVGKGPEEAAPSDPAADMVVLRDVGQVVPIQELKAPSRPIDQKRHSAECQRNGRHKPAFSASRSADGHSGGLTCHKAAQKDTKKLCGADDGRIREWRGHGAPG